MDALKDLEPFVDDAINVFLDCMKQRNGEVVDMGNWVQLFAFGRLRYAFGELGANVCRCYW